MTLLNQPGFNPIGQVTQVILKSKKNTCLIINRFCFLVSTLNLVDPNKQYKVEIKPKRNSSFRDVVIRCIKNFSIKKHV